MTDKHLIIIGGGLAGMSAGVYGRRNGFRTTIVEHNLALGGVCTSWKRGPYTVDGCIHWLTGGPFSQVYEELGILPKLGLNTLDTWSTYRDASTGLSVTFTRDLDHLVAQLSEISPKDAPELRRMREAATEFVAVKPPIHAVELTTVAEGLRSMWEMRSAAGTLMHFRKPLGVWVKEHLHSPVLQRLFTHMIPEQAPALFLLMVLGYLEKGYLSRPRGGTAAFRDALEHSYRALGGEALLHHTVDEVLVTGNRARGVRLEDGTILEADAVISTASAPETVLRLLGGRFDADATRHRMEQWKLFDPIVLVSFGVATPYADQSSLQIVDGVPSFNVGDRESNSLYLRVCNDDSSFAPPGHTVVQAMVPTNYEWWATRGKDYNAAKEDVSETVLRTLEPLFPRIRSATRMVDVATPITYWGMARSWRGAYEGWMPSPGSFFTHMKKKLAGLDGFYMAGQWVEPGGGVPVAVTSGRQAIELLCNDEQQSFVAR